MKKFLSVFLCFALFLTSSIYAFAIENIEPDYNSIIYFEDGSYITEECANPTDILPLANVKTKKKTYNYYNSDDVLQWTATLTGEFTYTGTSATCISANISFVAHVSSWKCTSSSATESGAQARGNVTVKKYVLGIPTKTIEQSLILKCSATGTIT